MRRGRSLFALGTLTLAVLGLVACAPAEEQVEEPDGGDEWVWLQEAKSNLDTKRLELKELRDRAAGKLPPEPEAAAEDAAGDAAAEDAAGEAAEGEEAEEAVPLTPEELQAQIEALEEELNTLSDDFGARLATFLNAQELVVGGELNSLQRQAIDMKVDEDMVLAQGWIDEGGDYQRAINIYNDAMRLDPENERLKEAIATAEDLRHMKKERFDLVKKKMTQDEVRELLGQVYHRNIREYPEDNAVGWFFQKDDGGAAAVFFQEKKKGDGEWLVYDADFEAIKQQVIGGEEEGEADDG